MKITVSCNIGKDRLPDMKDPKPELVSRISAFLERQQATDIEVSFQAADTPKKADEAPKKGRAKT